MSSLSSSSSSLPLLPLRWLLFFVFVVDVVVVIVILFLWLLYMLSANLLELRSKSWERTANKKPRSCVLSGLHRVNNNGNVVAPMLQVIVIVRVIGAIISAAVVICCYCHYVYYFVAEVSSPYDIVTMSVVVRILLLMPTHMKTKCSELAASIAAHAHHIGCRPSVC